MLSRFLLLLLSLTICLGLNAQNAGDERVLFTVEGVPVTVGEFSYIYAKTNGDNANFSRQTLEEYLDLYVRFKLKVQRAREMRLDTIPGLMDELEGYRRQLSDSYLIDRTIVDKLIEEAYQHAQEDADISHILFALSENPAPADTLAAYERAMSVRKRLDGGADFAAMAAEHSDDRYTKERGGRVGFIAAPFPTGLHRLEYAAYSSPLKTVVGPVRTFAGYHLLVVNARRPARGEIEAAHILVRKEGRSPEEARRKIDSLYTALQQGASFTELARNHSEDGRSSLNGGIIGFFGVNRYETSFEDAAFAIQKDEAYSSPVETTVGWHIIKRISRKGLQPFAIEKARLDGIIRKDPRFEEAKLQMLDRIRVDNQFAENTSLLEGFLASLPDSFVTFRWKAPQPPSKDRLFSLKNNYVVTLGEFTDYLGGATRERATLAREGSAADVGRILYEQFIDDQLLKYEERQLETKFPEFKALMREYEEGILLFEATKMEVWDRATQDTVALDAFFKSVANKYSWLERGRIVTYRVAQEHKDKVTAIQEYAKTHTPEEVKNRFNTAEATVVTTDEAVHEKGRNPLTAKMLWQVGAVSAPEESNRSRGTLLYQLVEIIPPAPKTLNEARGYVIADFQDKLERDWVAGLQKKYAVQINKAVFESLIR